MKGKFYTLMILSFAAITMVSCKSASKLYKQGNYDEAVEVAVKKLQKKPNDAELRSIIQSAYEYAVNDHESRIRNYSESNNDLKWEWIYNEYQDLQNLYNAIYSAPSVFELVQPVNYSSYITTYREKAGDARITRGMNWMDRGDKESFKKAFYEFQAALSFKPGDIKTQDMMDDAYDAAVTRVVIAQVDNYGFQFSSYNNSFQSSSDGIIRNLQNNSGNFFVRFYSVMDAKSKAIIPDEVIELRLNHMDIGGLQESRDTREVSKEVVVKETVYKPDSVIKQYAKVKARITTTRKTIYSTGDLTVTVRDENGNYLWNDLVTADNSWSTAYASYTGDERALSEEDKRFLNSRADNIPHESYIIDCIRQELYNNTLYRIKNYYSRY